LDLVINLAIAELATCKSKYLKGIVAYWEKAVLTREGSWTTSPIPQSRIGMPYLDVGRHFKNSR
jgi:hypothetical protein